ncbi:MAG: IclR family transcriptional regulator [Eubacteriales bacterium]|nr:IclR family transcriptional regulator [Eubacteriales bacterium]MDD3073463.1 IclR family transcriptional regulator [Eubacteriales bacterium]MDD4078629.1 IclR family transcriptional regulator [Eubacteriales bacterium]MDD4769277.1 IclR family transcriptional regulator [Eubacteriales bacterium]
MAKEQYLIQSVSRASAIIEALSNHNTMGVTEIGKFLGLHKSTVYGLISTLEHEGYVQQNPQTGKYALTLKMFEIGGKVFGKLDMRKIARPHIEQIMLKHRETAHLVVPDGLEIVYIDKVECTQSMRICSNVGKRMPFHCTGVGKVLLANMPVEQVDEILRKKGMDAFTENTITDYNLLQKELEKIKVLGYAVDNEEAELGLRCVAAPIRDINGKVIAATSVSGPKVRMDDEKIKGIVADLMAMNEEISAKLGY